MVTSLAKTVQKRSMPQRSNHPGLKWRATAKGPQPYWVARQVVREVAVHAGEPGGDAAPNIEIADVTQLGQVDVFEEEPVAPAGTIANGGEEGRSAEAGRGEDVSVDDELSAGFEDA